MDDPCIRSYKSWLLSGIKQAKHFTSVDCCSRTRVEYGCNGRGHTTSDNKIRIGALHTWLAVLNDSILGKRKLNVFTRYAI